jgi:hypothetical protein
MSNEMLNIVRASSPAHEYVRTNRSPPTFLSTTDLTAAGAFAFAEPAAGAFATPHNSGIIYINLCIFIYVYGYICIYIYR